MSAFYAATALGSPVTQRLAAHLPVPVVLAVAALVASTTMLVTSQATGVATLLAVLAVGGFSNGLVQPAAGRLITANVPARRHSLAAALSATGNNAVASYFVQLGTNSGLATALAGNLLSASALIAVAVRIAAGALTDRAPHRNPAVIAMMMLTGALGLTLIAIGNPDHVRARRGTGLLRRLGLDRAAARHHVAAGPSRAEYAGHTVQVGVYTGATIAPFAFGTLSSSFGFAGTALMAAAAALAAAASMATGTRLLQRIR